MAGSSELIPVPVAAKILGIYPQGVRDKMAKGELEIGYVQVGKHRRNTYRIYRAKLASYLGRPSGYIWPEEAET